MTQTLGSILHSAGIDPRDAQAIRHSYVPWHEDSSKPGIHANSSDEEILAYTSEQSATSRRVPAVQPPLWVVFLKDAGRSARFWSVVENRGEIANDGTLRYFDLAVTEQMADLRDRLVIGWSSPIVWRIKGSTVAEYPVLEGLDV